MQLDKNPIWAHLIYRKRMKNFYNLGMKKVRDFLQFQVADVKRNDGGKQVKSTLAPSRIIQS